MFSLRQKIIKPLFIALGFLPAFLLRFFNIRFLPVTVDRIGHLAIEPDCYLKERILGLRPTFKTVLLCAPKSKVANQALAGYWSQHFVQISAPWLCAALKPLSVQKMLRDEVEDYAVAINKTAAFCEIQKNWGNRPPLLSLTREHTTRGEIRLRLLGVPEGAWFVCIHSREGEYSPHDEHHHSFRNSNIETYSMAMKAIVDQGGWCIRLGDPTMKKISPMDRVIDYAHHSLREDWMDLFLAARCRFFLGCSSGPFLMASIFGTPVAVVNSAPLSTVLPFGRKDLGIPKLLWSRQKNRLLTFPEIFASPLANMRYAKEFESAGVDIKDNTPEEIADLALEQLGNTERHSLYTHEDDALQLQFKSLMKLGHYTFGCESRIGRDFIKKHSFLLGSTK